MITTGSSGYFCLIRSSRAKPSMPGMRTSEMMASGWDRSSASMTPLALEKQVTCMPALLRAFSSTQRIERSSSMTQT